MNQWELLDVIEQNPNLVSGAWVFKGTRVPVAALFQNPKDGATIHFNNSLTCRKSNQSYGIE
jgi:uncharacterized protein (DUF433 family)